MLMVPLVAVDGDIKGRYQCGVLLLTFTLNHHQELAFNSILTLTPAHSPRMSQLAHIKKLGREGTINMQASLSPSSSGRDATDRRNRREVDRKFLRSLNKDQVKSYAIVCRVLLLSVYLR